MEPMLEDPGRLLTRYGVALSFRPRDAEASYRRAVVRSRLGRWEQALADARVAAELAPADRRVHFLIGRIQLTLGRLGEAVTSLRRAIDCPARPDDLHAELAEASLLNAAASRCVADPAHLHKPVEALPLIFVAIEIVPLPSYRTTLGVAHYRLGRHRDAIACFERNLHEQTPSGLPRDLYFLAMSYRKAGDPARARAQFDRAIEVQAKLGLVPSQVDEMNAYRAEAERTLGMAGATTPPSGRAPNLIPATRPDRSVGGAD
jgi:tetratricopeptide (TPR) repeat protein